MRHITGDSKLPLSLSAEKPILPDEVARETLRPALCATLQRRRPRGNRTWRGVATRLNRVAAE